MKKVIIVVAVLVVGVGVLLAAFFSFNQYIYDQKQAPNPEPPVLQADQEKTPSVSRYENASLGLAFSYTTGDDGYRLYEPDAAVEDGPIKTLLLVHTDDVPQMENPPVGGEGPATLTVQVFENTNKQFARMWAESHSQHSNIGLLLGEITDVVVGGANAIRYRADGLFPMQVVVVPHGDNVYVVSGAYHDETSPTFRDFDALIASVTFIQAPDQ